jgi:hypothetical protein
MNDETEFIFRVPFDSTTNIFDTIENMLYQLNSNPNIINAISNIDNNNEYIHFDIFYDDIDNIDNINNENNDGITEPIHFHIHNYNHNQNLEDNNYFKNCQEINDKLMKPEKIKKDDTVLTENCLICMENYKELELKRLLPSCKHYFHKKCIDKWLKKNASCPICRNKLL